MLPRRRDVWPLIKLTFSSWYDDNASRLAAALAFYTALSLAPLLLVIIAIAGAVFGADAARGEIVGQVGKLIGRDGAETVQAVVQSAAEPSTGIFASIVGVVILLVGASGVFGELQSALDTIWHVKPRPGRGLRGLIKDRFWSFTMVVGVGFLLLVSLVVTTILSALSNRYSWVLESWPLIWQVINTAASFAVTTLLFALIFKIVPDIRIRWRDVWFGAVVTAVLFSLGRYLVGMYLGGSALRSSYGAAGSLVAVLVWVYYSAQILFLGAECTRAYVQLRGGVVTTDRDAVPAEPPCVEPVIFDHGLSRSIEPTTGTVAGSRTDTDRVS